MQWTNGMNQGALLKALGTKLPSKSIETSGVCFRASTKWALCRAAGGTYRYAGLNIEKTYDKHRGYRDVTLKLAKTTSFADPTQTKSYLDADFSEEQKFIDQWGASFVDATKQRFTGYGRIDVKRGIAAKSALDTKLTVGPNPALIYTFFWRPTSTGAPAGHTVAFDDNVLFDPNFGETVIKSKGIAERLLKLRIDCYGAHPLYDEFLFLVGKRT